MSKCIQLTKWCKKCDRRFENHEQMVHCPECGESRNCGNRPMAGFDRCCHHGGPQPQHGYYGRKGNKFSMTSNKGTTSPLNQVATKYLEIQSDPQAQTLRPLHSILNSRLMVLLERVKTNDSSSRMGKVLQLWKRFKKWHPKLAQYFFGAESTKAFNDLDAELEATYHDYEAWREIYTLIDEKTKVSVAEMKILKDMKALISAEDVHDLVGQVLASVAKVVNDPTKLEQIRYELAAIIGDPIAGRVEKREPTPVNVRTSGMDPGQILHSGDPERSNIEGEDNNDGLSEGHIEGSFLEG